MAVASTVTSTVGAVRQATYEARVADYNKQLEGQKIIDATERGNIAVRDAARRQAQMMGAQRAALAANGIDLSFGSAADLMADTAMLASDERSNIRENTRREIMGYDTNMANFSSQAKAARSARTGMIMSGVLEVGSTLASSAQRYGKIKYDQKNGTGAGWGGF